MKTAFALLAMAALLPAQDGGKWKPYQFKGNERYEYKMTLVDGDDKKETGYILDIRNKGAEDFEVTWSTKSAVKKASGAEILAGGFAGMSPALMLMNPLHGAFLEQVDLKEGEKMSLLGAGVIKVTKKETVGGRTGLICELWLKQDDKDVLSSVWTVDPALALPIRVITMEEGKEKNRMELLSYKKD